MRKDMKHVVIDRVRHGGGLKAPKGEKKVLQQDPELLPSRESIRKKWKASGHSKDLSDHISPLRRFLESNVGQPWDKVYSELSKNLDKRSVTGRHVFTHIDVVTNTFIGDDGKVWGYWHNGLFMLEENSRYGGGFLYVHPKTGRLCIGKDVGWKQKNKLSAPDVRPIREVEDKFFQFRRRKEVWYDLELEKIPLVYEVRSRVDRGYKSELRLHYAFDYWLKQTVLRAGLVSKEGEQALRYYCDQPWATHRFLYVCKSYHQLNKKELKNNNLKD